MISIFVMYSPDRLSQFKILENCLSDMYNYKDCQKILVVDGETNISPDNWEVIEVPRLDKEFCWANMWEAGVTASTFENILYLDSDRILPRTYLQLVLENLSFGKFLFCENLFRFKNEESLEDVKKFRDRISPQLLKQQQDRFRHRIWYDPRFKLPCDGPGKGVMSGNTAFTKETFREMMKLDPFFRGHGAYADSDLHRYAHEKGAEMIDLGVLELHLFHEKLIDDQKPISFEDLEILSLKNFVYYCVKWKVSLERAKYIEKCLKLEEGYVRNSAKQFSRLF